MRTTISSMVLVAALISMPLQASPLSDARTAGQVTEQPSGYVKAGTDVSPAISALVADVNKRRRQAYSRIAKKNGISVDQVAKESYVRRSKQAGAPGSKLRSKLPDQKL
ncbi:MAG: hypothetical protein CMQ19_02185 [Gammaproteobacteria bacterium]|jgi:hypothetical protein|nr:hypothetical protein [Gammaproteobacteria bacterium]